MDKVYLILRDNRQTGPYTIGELLQQQLRPTDMIWIEGKSTAWGYLSEMELKPSVSVSTKEEKSRVVTEPAKRPVTSPTPEVPEANKPKRRSSPPDEIERKAEELRKQALNAGPQYSRFIEPQINFEESHSRVLMPVEEEIDFVDHREQKKLPVVEIVSGVLVTAFVVACFFGGRSLIINQQSAPVTIVAAKEVSTTEHLAKRPVPAAATMMIATNNEVAPAQTDSIAVDSTTIVKKPKTKISKPVITSAQLNKNGASTPLVEPVASITKKEESTVNNPEVATTETETKNQESEKKEIVQQTNSNNSVDQPEEKKKGLFKKIFGKKKKD